MNSREESAFEASKRGPTETRYVDILRVAETALDMGGLESNRVPR